MCGAKNRKLSTRARCALCQYFSSPRVFSRAVLHPVIHLLFFFCCSEVISRARFLFLVFGDLTPRIRYSIRRAVVNLIEHKGFRYSSNAICNRATYPIKSSCAVGCTPTRRQTLDKFYSLLLHSSCRDFLFPRCCCDARSVLNLIVSLEYISLLHPGI